MQDLTKYKEYRIGTDFIPRAGDWTYAPKDKHSGVYEKPSKILDVKPNDHWMLGTLVADGPANFLGVSEDNLKGFLWYRPRKQIVVIK